MQLPQLPISWRQHWGKRSWSEVWEFSRSGEHQPGCEIMYMGAVGVSTILTTGIMGYVHLNYRKSGRAQKRLWTRIAWTCIGLPGASNKRPRDLGGAKHWVPENQAVRIQVTLTKTSILKRSAHKEALPPAFLLQHSEKIKWMTAIRLWSQDWRRKRLIPFSALCGWWSEGESWRKDVLPGLVWFCWRKACAKSCKLHNREESVPKCKYLFSSLLSHPSQLQTQTTVYIPNFHTDF